MFGLASNCWGMMGIGTMGVGVSMMRPMLWYMTVDLDDIFILFYFALWAV